MIINFKKKKIMLLTKEQQESWKCVKICYICNEKVGNKTPEDDKYQKVREHCHYRCHCQVNIEVLHIAYVISSIVYLRKFFTMDLAMITILS